MVRLDCFAGYDVLSVPFGISNRFNELSLELTENKI